MHHGVAILHTRIVADDIAGDVLVRHLRPVGSLAGFIFRLHGLFSRCGLLALCGNDALVCFRSEFPVLGAIHSIVASHDRADHSIADGRKLLVETGDIFQRRTGRRVASVKERMHNNLAFRELLARLTHKLEEMLLMSMHTFILKESEKMERRVVALPVRDECLPLCALEEFAGGKAVVNALEFLNNDTSRAHV